MEMPQVSVIIPAYNVARYLEFALVSLVRQTYRCFEALIVDDGSTDNTAKIAMDFCRRDSRFRLLQKSNGGLSSARNYGIKQALGKYIALLDGDDVYCKEKLATHVRILEDLERVGVVYSASKAIRDDGKETFMTISGKPVNRDPVIALLCKNFIVHGSNAVFRRRLIEEVGEFDESLRSCEDVDFWLRIATTRRWHFYRLSRVSCCYRIRPSGLSFNVRQMEESRQKVIETAYQRSPETIAPWLDTARAYTYRYLGRVSLSSGDRRLASSYLKRAWQADSSIFWRDRSSFFTAIAIILAPVAQLVIGKILGIAEPKPENYLSD